MFAAEWPFFQAIMVDMKAKLSYLPLPQTWACFSQKSSDETPINPNPRPQEEA